VEGLLAGENLDAVAAIKTIRTAYRVVNADGDLVLEIADDQVESGPPDGESMLHSWREVEIELGPAGNNKDLKRARKLILTAGASPNASKTKLDRALGPVLPDGKVVAVEAGTLGELVTAYVATQCQILASNDVGMRTDMPAIHKTRVAVRRLRSTLRIFAKVFKTSPAEELDQELSWYADALGEVRDRDILSNRLIKQIAELPPDQVRGSIEAEITNKLAAERQEALERLNEAMCSPRYMHLVQLLRAWRTAPPLTRAAGKKARSAVKYVDKAMGKAEKRLRKADDDIDQLHRARKAMKRARYAAELVEPADKGMKAIARDAEEMQTLLGEHQDAVIAGRFLAEVSSADGISEGSGFTYGVLMARELQRAAQVRASLKF
jgi:CHAD domain-containing protein